MAAVVVQKTEYVVCIVLESIKPSTPRRWSSSVLVHYMGRKGESLTSLDFLLYLYRGYEYGVTFGLEPAAEVGIWANSVASVSNRSSSVDILCEWGA